MEIKSVLDWLLANIGLEGTVLFCIIVIMLYFVTVNPLRIAIGQGKTKQNKDWWNVAAQLKKEQHSAQREYISFNSKVRGQRKIDANDQRMLQSLKDRYEYAKKKRKAHLEARPVKKSHVKLLSIILALVIGVFMVINYPEATIKFFWHIVWMIETNLNK